MPFVIIGIVSGRQIPINERTVVPSGVIDIGVVVVTEVTLVVSVVRVVGVVEGVVVVDEIVDEYVGLLFTVVGLTVVLVAVTLPFPPKQQNWSVRQSLELLIWLPAQTLEIESESTH